MRLKVSKILLILCLNPLFSQEKISGVILSDYNNLPLENVTIFNSDTNEISYSDLDGNFSMTIYNIDSEINFFLEGFNLLTKFYSPETRDLKNVEIRLIDRKSVV